MDRLDPEGVGDKVLQYFSNYLLIGMACYGRKRNFTIVITSLLAHTKVFGFITHQTTVLTDYICFNSLIFATYPPHFSLLI
jgi:hypothetical protein